VSARALRPLLVLGLDGATFDVIDPLARAGRLPTLGAWRERGVATPLASTTPPMSFPAWSSFATGLAPGQHGLFDFTQKVGGAYRIGFANATHRSGETLWGRASRAGAHVLVLGVPATFPPEPVRGLLVSGFDAPVSTGSDARQASDPALYRRIAARVGPWMRPDLDEGAHAQGWHEQAVGVLLRRIERKTAFALAALDELRRTAGARPELVVVVFSESDTVAHHFWRDHDPASPRHDPTASEVRRGAVAAVYMRLDAACAELRAAYGEDAPCVVLSDHGSGGSARRVVHLGRRLADAGLLRRARAGGAGLDRIARSARDLALRTLPPRAAQALFRRARPAAARLESQVRFGGIDWRRTAAFSEDVNTQPGVWLNLRGREARGCVDASDAERVRREAIDCLLDWKLPDGGPIVARALPREEVHRGPFAHRAPDVVVELAEDAGYPLVLVPTPWSDRGAGSLRLLGEGELAGGRGRGTNGTHRRHGIWIADAPGRAAWARLPEPAELVGAAPALAAALGLAWDAIDGSGAGMASGRRLDYTPDEEAAVAKRLRALGYLD
jgi:predicted AlkP superfamily phosphohydrolase/phosphomutase